MSKFFRTVSRLEIKDRISMLDTLEVVGKRCAEIGILKGDYSAEILKRKPESLLLIDAWKHQDDLLYDDINNHPQEKFEEICASVKIRFVQEIADKQVRIMRSFSHEAAREVKDQSLDFVYIDACHNFDSVLSDLAMWHLKVVKGGWIAGHDFGSQFWGVRQAATIFCRMTGYKIAFVTQENEFSTFAIRI